MILFNAHNVNLQLKLIKIKIQGTAINASFYSAQIAIKNFIHSKDVLTYCSLKKKLIKVLKNKAIQNL
jgi:hypothetical protein